MDWENVGENSENAGKRLTWAHGLSLADFNPRNVSVTPGNNWDISIE